MTTEQWLALGLLVLAVLCVALAVTVVRLRSGERALREETRQELEHLRQEIRAAASPQRAGDDGEIVVAEPLPPATAPRTGPHGRVVHVAEPIDGRLFADQVLRETVVSGASWWHGLRRAASPESRNRIRFQMRQQVRRTRKQRRADFRAFQREQAARERAAATAREEGAA